MKALKRFRVVYAILIIGILSAGLSSCAASRAKSSNNEKRGLMLQDKADYSRNKSKFKGSKAYKHQKKRMKKSGKKR
ncbi:MAG: hypothetical protein H6540_06280 [Bacteroidales bacterium]|nr:hypothetical protein [Bacteroidales bacterium]MCB9012765.1 hypothetical protein [Bacteroidales bacterium]